MIKKVLRFDTVGFKATKTEEGYIVDSPVVTRTGIFLYKNADGSIRREYRPPEEVFNEDSLASYKGKPISDGHPPGITITSTNVKEYSVGSMVSIGYKDEEDPENVRVDISIQDIDAVDKAVNGGKRGLSLGYELDLDETPGETNGERYDAIQKNIRINHLSIVESGRAGGAARINLDADDAIQIEKEETMLPKTRIDGIEYEASQEVINALEKLRTDSATLREEIVTLKKDGVELTASKEKLQGRVDGLDDELKKAKTDAYDLAKKDLEQRVDINDLAKKLKVELDDKMSIIDRKKAIISSIRKDADLTDKADEYIDGAYDLIKEHREDEGIISQRVDGVVINKDEKTDVVDSDKARQEMIDKREGKK